MGRYTYSNRRLVENCHIVSIKDFKDKGKLENIEERHRAKFSISPLYPADQISLPPPRVELSYGLPTQYGESLWKEYEVEITYTRCNFGGKRWWFFCNCGKRVGKLYLPVNESIYRCRKCYYLTYKARKEHNRHYRAWQKAADYEVKLSKLASKIKRQYYGKKPTKKFKQYLNYLEKYNAIYPHAIQQLKKLHLSFKK